MPPKRCADSGFETKRKRFKSTFKETITVKVGEREGEETFIVYEDGICARSPFFKAACSERWSEDDDKTVLLPDYEPDPFRAYLQWTYGEQDLFGLVKDASQAHADCVKAMSPHFPKEWFTADLYVLLTTAELWSLGDYLGDMVFTNTLIDTLHHAMSLSFYSAWTIDRIFATTQKGCALQLYIVDYAADKLMAENASHIEGYGVAFQMALLKEMLARKTGQESLRNRNLLNCKYHNHDNGGKGNKESSV